MKKLAVARLWYEGNSFSPVPTGLPIFEARELVHGEAAKDFYRGTATEIGAAVAFAESNKEWSVEFLLCAAAPPGGPIAPDAFAVIRDTMLEGLGRDRWDAVYLSLHGAAITADDPTPDLHLLERVRHVIGRIPLGVSFDLHANLGRPMIEAIDVAVGYKTYPHIDMAEVGARAIALVTAMADGKVRPQGALAKVPAILPSFNMRTTDGPMAELAALAAELRKKPDILDASIFGGFAYGDSPFAGASALVYTDGDRALAEQAAHDLAAAITARRDRFTVHLPSPAEGIAQALATAGSKPAAVVDPADNPLSGGIGDTPTLFQALLAAKPNVATVFGFFFDPDLVARCHREGEGARIATRLGGRITDAFGPPIAVDARVVRLTDGKFRNRGPMENNLPVDLGRTAVLDVDGIQVIVTESCQTPNDPGYFALHGIDLAKVGLLCVKAKNHFRAAFTPLTRAIIDVDCPGPAAADLRHYRFQHAPKSLYPLNR
ncbi:MAG TPA: M81 family metallopeptidase [Dongiaceae bacterium]|nr:M81 family metallopeptidase [Dongiaceae bacterium]